MPARNWACANENGGSSCCHCSIRRLSHLWVPGWRSLLGGKEGDAAHERAGSVFFVDKAGACMNCLPRWGLGAPCCPFILLTGMPWNFMVIKEKDATDSLEQTRDFGNQHPHPARNTGFSLNLVRTILEHNQISTKQFPCAILSFWTIKFQSDFVHPRIVAERQRFHSQIGRKMSEKGSACAESQRITAQ